MSRLTASQLGYEPRPELTCWRGTPIPPLLNPLQATPPRLAIAKHVWWHGPPWSVLRNSSYYLWHVWDYGTDDHVAFTRHDVPLACWHRALEDARPGLVSRSAYVLWSVLLGRIADNLHCDWPRSAHVKDLRPLSGLDPATLYRRAAAARALRQNHA